MSYAALYPPPRYQLKGITLARLPLRGTKDIRMR